MTTATARHQKVSHKRINIEVAAKDITTTHNPRWPMPNLQKQGYIPIELFKGWVTNGTPEQRAEYCTLIETTEPSIVALAESIKKGEEERGYGQLQAIIVRPFRAKVGTEVEDESGDSRNVYETRYGLIAGERRLGANRYLKAKYDLELPLMAIAVECTKDEAYDMAIEENAHRQDPNDLEWGAMYAWYREKRQRVNTDGSLMEDEDGKPLIGWTVEEIGVKFQKHPGHIRGRLAVAKAVETGKLTPQQVNHYLEGKIKITRLVEMASGQKPYRNPLEPHHRRGVRTLAEARKRFDELNSGINNEEQMKVLAWFMLYDHDNKGHVTAAGLKEAIKDSNARLAEEAGKPVKKQAAKRKPRKSA
jgi:hypothetical protein